MHTSGNTAQSPGGHALVAVLRNDPSVWWSWTETARRVIRLHAQGDAFNRGALSGRDAAVADLADRLRWSYARDGVCQERREWRDAAEELMNAVGGARGALKRSIRELLPRIGRRAAQD